MGLVEVERLQKSYDLEVQFTPFLLHPETPPEGEARPPRSKPGDPPTSTEQRATGLGITFTRGRTWTSNSHLSLEAAAFALEHGDALRFHRLMFKAYFEDLEDIGDIEVVVRVGAASGLSESELREALTSGTYREQVDQEIQWGQDAGVTAVPTFVLGEKYGIVGAQEAPVFQDVLLRKLGRSPKA